ncbi:unnamed protein product [Schistosoma turkestanicum]|nr:unnamed protein product [Schistosoma turkestanicum]
MNKINTSSITQNHVYGRDVQTEFQLQTPCISNFIDYDFSPIGVCHNLYNNNNNNNSNHSLLQRVEHYDYHQNASKHGHQPQPLQSQQLHNDIHHDHYQYDTHLSNYSQNQYIPREDRLNSLINVNMTHTTTVTEETEEMRKIGVDNYFLSEFHSSTNQLPSSYSKSIPVNSGKQQQAFQDFHELLLDIYHIDNDTNNVRCDESLIVNNKEAGKAQNKGDSNNNNNANRSQYSTSASAVVASSLSTNNNTIHAQEDKSIQHNVTKEMHRINSLVRRHEELSSTTCMRENAALHKAMHNQVNTDCSISTRNYHSHETTTTMNEHNSNRIKHDQINRRANTKTQKSKSINSNSPKGKLELNFLLNQGNTVQDISKYGKVAETIITKGGIPKLFVIRGRVIDTRIQFHYFKSNKNEPPLINHHHHHHNDDIDDVDLDNGDCDANDVHVDADVDDNNKDDNLNSVKSRKFKLRFKPFTIFGGMCTPAIGYNDPMQIPNILLKQEQLCFIQAVQNENNVTYKLMNDGYLVMEIDFHNFCDIYHLVFPFLNSKCPSTWKKDVHITVTLIDENDKELSSAEFEVVSCASPIRDARRYQQRQLIAELELTEKHLHKTIAKNDNLLEWDRQTGQPVSQSISKFNISDISPNSSGFGSLYSPLASITSEEEHVNELQLYLSRSETSTPTHYLSNSVSTNSSNTTTITTTNKNNSSISDADNSKSDILSPSTSNDELIDLSNWNQMQTLKQKRLINNLTKPYSSERNRRNSLVKQSNEQQLTSSKMINSKYSMKRLIKEIDNGSSDEQEYVIKTKSRRIYRILSLLNRELSRHL